jgi:uncharacterized protein
MEVATKATKTVFATKVTKITKRFGSVFLCALCVLCGLYVSVPSVAAQDIPALTAPVNDFANVIDPATEQALDRMIRALQAASGDVVVVATVDTFQPYGDIREYAVEMFENQGRGIGQRGRDNGLLVLLAVQDREVWTEVGYDLEEFITDGFAGQVAREEMIPEFRGGNYSGGLQAGVARIIGRIAQRRNVTLDGVPLAEPRGAPDVGSGGHIILALFVLFMVINAIAGRTRRRGRRGRPWSRWHSGVGPFGGPFGGGFGGFGGGGFGGGGFGGFGGGRSGGGGGGGGW